MGIEQEVQSFNKVLNEFNDEIRQKGTIIVRKFILMALEGLVMKTPVDTGRARGGWQASVYEPDESKTERMDKSGGSVITAEFEKISPLVIEDPFRLFWITNAVTYIYPLETGHSKQARNGMLAVTFQELRGIAAEMKRLGQL